MADASARLIGILGGTFDPVHIGHLRPALDLLSALPLQQIRLIPNQQPPHRPAPMLDAAQRLQLLQQSCRELDGLVVDDCELKRTGASYMVDTLRQLKQQFAGQTLCLIIGSDAYNSFCSWYQWQDILSLAHLVVMQRAGTDAPSNTQLQSREVDDAESLLASEAGAVLIQSVSQLDVSATQIRQMVKQGQDIHFLVPEEIRHDVQTLYK